MADDTGDVDLGEFRREARRLVDWIADYLADPERYPVLSPLRPGAVRETISAAPPAAAEALSRRWSQTFGRVGPTRNRGRRFESDPSPHLMEAVAQR